MTETTTIGVDLAKNIFHLCVVGHSGHIIKKLKLNRIKFKEFIIKSESSDFVFEACAGSHYWARFCEENGHRARLINPAYVKPFVKTNKTDFNDAEAILEADSRPTMRYVKPKTVTQQEVLILHRVRERLVGQRTALINQIRGLLSEFGIVVAVTSSRLRQELPLILEDADNELRPLSREQFAALLEELKYFDELINNKTRQIENLSQQNRQVRKILKIPGVGILTSSAIVAASGDIRDFKNGREFSAWLGLVPRQYSTGGKERLLGISKRGDNYLRRLLVQGAMAAINISKADDWQLTWARKLKKDKCMKLAAVALANKTARIIWAVLAHDKEYRAQV